MAKNRSRPGKAGGSGAPDGRVSNSARGSAAKGSSSNTGKNQHHKKQQTGRFINARSGAPKTPKRQTEGKQPGPVRTLTSAFLGSARSARGTSTSPQLARQLRLSGENNRQHSEDQNTPVAARQFSSTFFVALIFAVFLLIGTYPTLNNYFNQQHEINETRQHIAQLEKENDQLKVEKTWWDNDDYVRQQARDRLYYVSEGDTPYTVTGLNESTLQVDDTSASAKNAPEDSWTNKLWSSVENPQPAQ